MTAWSRSIVIRERMRLDLTQRAWELEASVPIAHSRAFPRDLRGRLLLRRDHLFDVYLPGNLLPVNLQRGRATYAYLQRQRRSLAPDARRRQRARLLCRLTQFLHRSTLSGYRKSLQRSFVLFGGRASAIRVTRYGRSRRWMDRCIWWMG